MAISSAIRSGPDPGAHCVSVRSEPAGSGPAHAISHGSYDRPRRIRTAVFFAFAAWTGKMPARTAIDRGDLNLQRRHELPVFPGIQINRTARREMRVESRPCADALDRRLRLVQSGG